MKTVTSCSCRPTNVKRRPKHIRTHLTGKLHIPLLSLGHLPCICRPILVHTAHISLLGASLTLTHLSSVTMAMTGTLPQSLAPSVNNQKYMACMTRSPSKSMTYTTLPPHVEGPPSHTLEGYPSTTTGGSPLTIKQRARSPKVTH